MDQYNESLCEVENKHTTNIARCEVEGPSIALCHLKKALEGSRIKKDELPEGTEENTDVYPSILSYYLILLMVFSIEMIFFTALQFNPDPETLIS